MHMSVEVINKCEVETQKQTCDISISIGKCTYPFWGIKEDNSDAAVIIDFSGTVDCIGNLDVSESSIAITHVLCAGIEIIA